ncbi:MAG: DNA polymerase III subunit delta [Hahellaceae bacterium]|nr:DNA polymerase III subunit delta [Hahellaceae bacterium]
MKIKPEQLSQHLSKSLLPIYLVSGDEPLLLQEACDAIRKAAKAAGVQDRQCFTDEKHFDWNQLLEEANSLSLFADKKLLEVRNETGKFSEDASKALENYCKNPAMDNIILIISAKVDAATQKKKWFTALEKIGAFVQVWPVKPEQLPAWLNQRLTAAGFQADASAIELLQERIEGNLLAAQQEIDKLQLLTQENKLDANTILDAVGNSARYSAFDLSDACLKGQLPHAIRILQGLQSEGQAPIAILGILMRNIRVLQELHGALRAHQPTQGILTKGRVYGPSQGMYLNTAKRMNSKQFKQVFELASSIDLSSKGMLPHQSPWELLTELTFAVCGNSLQV